MTSDIQRFFLVHMQKTAGTSLRNRFLNHFPPSAVFPNGDDRDPARPHREYISVDHLLQQWAVRGDEIRFIHGHFPRSVIDRIDADFVTFTIMRPPIERTLSLLRHVKKHNPAKRDLSLDQIYDDDKFVAFQAVNHMTRTMGLRTEDYGTAGVITTVPYDDALLERAKAGLASLDLFGLQTQFEDLCTELSARYDLDLGDPVRSNTTEPADSTPQLIERITADNELDLALYEYAVELYEQRRPSWVT